MKSKYLKGYTLVEVILAIMLIGITATTATNNYLSFKENAESMQQVTYKNSVEIAVREYYKKYSLYPCDVQPGASNNGTQKTYSLINFTLLKNEGLITEEPKVKGKNYVVDYEGNVYLVDNLSPVVVIENGQIMTTTRNVKVTVKVFDNISGITYGITGDITTPLSNQTYNLSNVNQKNVTLTTGNGIKKVTVTFNIPGKGTITVSDEIKLLEAGVDEDNPSDFSISNIMFDNVLQCVKIKWSESVDTSGIKEYQVYRSVNGIDYIMVGKTSTLKYEDYDLTSNTTYIYKIRAVDPFNHYTETMPKNVTVGTIINHPSVINNLVKDKYDCNTVEVIMAEITDLEGIDFVYLYKKTEGQSSWQIYNMVAGLGSEKNIYKVFVNVSDKEQYYIVAIDKKGAITYDPIDAPNVTYTLFLKLEKLLYDDLSNTNNIDNNLSNYHYYNKVITLP